MSDTESLVLPLHDRSVQLASIRPARRRRGDRTLSRCLTGLRPVSAAVSKPRHLDQAMETPLSRPGKGMRGHKRVVGDQYKNRFASGFLRCRTFGSSQSIRKERGCHTNRGDLSLFAVLDNERRTKRVGSAGRPWKQPASVATGKPWQPGNSSDRYMGIDTWPGRLRACPVYRFHEFARSSSLRDRLRRRRALLARKSTSVTGKASTTKAKGQRRAVSARQRFRKHLVNGDGQEEPFGTHAKTDMSGRWAADKAGNGSLQSPKGAWFHGR